MKGRFSFPFVLTRRRGRSRILGIEQRPRPPPDEPSVTSAPVPDLAPVPKASAELTPIRSNRTPGGRPPSPEDRSVHSASSGRSLTTPSRRRRRRSRAAGDADDISVGSRSSRSPRPTVVVVLLDPVAKTFELVTVPFDPEGRVDALLPNRTGLSGLCRPLTGEELPGFLGAGNCGIADGDVLVAVPKGKEARECAALANALLSRSRCKIVVDDRSPRRGDASVASADLSALTAEVSLDASLGASAASSPRSVGGAADPSLPRIHVVLLDPVARRFEIVRVPFRAGVDTADDLLAALDRLPLRQEALRRSDYAGLCRAEDGARVPPGPCQAGDGEVLVAVHPDLRARQCAKVARALLQKPKIRKMLDQAARSPIPVLSKKTSK